MLNFYKNITTNKNSVFYSLINYDNKIYAFFRKHWKNREIGQKTINDNFEINDDENLKSYNGEDPRCFYHNNRLFVVDNYFSDIHLIDIEKNKYLKLWVTGKNLSFISHNNHLYFIFKMKPFILCEVCLFNGKIRKIVSEHNENDSSYRGGTPGYFKSQNCYYGFGHKTYYSNDVLVHDIFLWELDFNNIPKIKITDIEQPLNSKNICDPTSIINVKNKKYLITAESDKPWFEEQNYYTNVYEINFPSTS